MKIHYLTQLFVRNFVFGPRKRFLGILLWVLFFPAVLGLIAVFFAYEINNDLRESGQQNIEQLDKLHQSVASAFAMLRSEVTAEPCSVAFHRQLSRVAFVPDGLNEFLYTPATMVTCSTSKDHFDQPVPL